MGRVSDYVRFALWLCGLAYIAAWPLIAPGDAGPIGASLICPLFQAFLCNFPHPFAVPPGLHWIGFLSAAWIGLLLASRLIRRLMMPRIHQARAASRLHARIPAAVRRKPQKPLQVVRRVQARKNFGLRGRPD